MVLKCLKKDVAFHRVSRHPIHIDFLVLDMSKKVRVTVEVKFLGKAKGVKESGGVFNALKETVLKSSVFLMKFLGSFEIDIAEMDH